MELKNTTTAEGGEQPKIKPQIPPLESYKVAVNGNKENSNQGPSDDDMSGKRSVEFLDEITNKGPCQRQTETLFARLHLQDKLQQKLSPKDFLHLCPSVTQHHVASEKNLAYMFIHRLMMLDYRARYISVRPDSPEGTDPKSSPVTDISDWDTFLSTIVDTHQKEQTRVHPMDVQMAVFHCSDSFLKQMIVTKLSQCQYALPLLVPDPVTKEIECPLWTFRQITKTWMVSQIKDGACIITMKSSPVCKAQTPLVSFFRLGSLSVSKSQLINALINDSHNTFFHRNCPGSTRSRHLMDGVAEIAWYCPAGKPTDAFSDCIAFCNLHGDALQVKKQRGILIEKSSINIFLVESFQKDEESRSLILELLESHKPLICIIEDYSCDIVRAKKMNYKIGLKGRTQPDVSEQLKKIIREVLSSADGPSSQPLFQLESMDSVSGITVDEHGVACKRGRSAALEIMELITKENTDISKINHLRGDSEKEKSEKQQKTMEKSQKQCDASCSKLMELFIQTHSPTEREYFLKWTKILLDDHSTENFSSVLHSLDENYLEVLPIGNKHDKSDLSFKSQTEMEDISKKVHSESFRLEHMFREMGNICDCCEYPDLTAELMISGHPVKLIDGDAGHLPLKGISSLLENVIQKLGDKRVFVLSVFGLESPGRGGRPSMLNTMLGLQSAVGAAGRCTKGAFMQLLKVSEVMKKDFGPDYVLVVHTEGLQAFELEDSTTPHHSNKLATFLVGLGNMMLINIIGDDLLMIQIILLVQALMRMKKVQLSPRCLFVHQNVTDVPAENNMNERKLLQKKLDQITKLVKTEVFDAECFTDVPQFDKQIDVKYCEHLWEGTPPMAPPNPGYSESLQEVKNTICKASQSAHITLSQLIIKIKDVWNALLNESDKAEMPEEVIEVLENLRPMVTRDCFQYAEDSLKKKSVNQNEVTKLCSNFVEQLQQAYKGEFEANINMLVQL
ncbi:interferon-induced very large GTPase 1-like isoform X2 [Simochromis diagramma]|uniref:interferon-induced very large GTPase 1-like isoform X2 n=1 Tax=Simochromis diagramma TaxID=43689 RepID=UPI001A7EEE8B|nr:interferon-induced very large GTPase 1-like isoform X2 [Simochromis diagramma]